jgi:hypothetical protein
MSKTPLADCNLWYDGTIEVEPEAIEAAMLRGVPVDKLAVTRVTSDVEMFNRFSGTKIVPKTECEIAPALNLPPEYLNLDVYGYILDNIIPLIPEDESKPIRFKRILDELEEYDRRGLMPLLRTLAYIIDTFHQKGVVWGVGRGSSCASYVLYLLGVHCVDPVKYNIPFSEFLR